MRRAQAGETFVITENGAEAARIVPPTRREGTMTVEDAIRTVENSGPKLRLSPEEIRDLIDDGRRN